MYEEIDMSRLDHMISPRIPPLPKDPADPLGMEAWAAYCGVPTHVGLAILASTLAGIAGPSCCPCHWGPSRSRPGLNLLCLEGEPFLATALDSLIREPWILQDLLVSRSRSLSPELLDRVMYAPAISEKNRHILAPLAALDDMHLGRTCPDRDYSIRLDRGRIVQEIRYEALVHPRFMMKGTLPVDLRNILVESHDGITFLAGCAERLPESTSARRKRVDELISFFDGTTVQPPVRFKRQLLAPTRHLRLTGLFFLSCADLEWIASNRRELLSRAIPLFPYPLKDSMSGCIENVGVFSARYEAIISEILDLRRKRHMVASWFQAYDKAAIFKAKESDYLREIQSLAGQVMVGEAIHLPVLMAWALHTLAWGEDREDYILDLVFEASHRILSDAVRFLREHDQKHLVEVRLTVARKIVKRLADIGPCKRRQLVRGLDQQSLQINEPVFRALLELGIITESDNRILDIGGTPFSNLQPADLFDKPC